MASQTCWKCISRLSIAPSKIHNTRFQFPISAFSSTSNRGKSTLYRKGKGVKLDKNVRRKGGKPPAPGERKVLKNRIVLSNPNAVDVELVEWSAANYADEGLKGQMVALPSRLIDSLRAIDAFQPNQEWGVFRRPATLVREETMELAKHIRSLEESSGEKRTLRRILVGPRGTGKSILTLQAQALAFQAGWIVIHIPDGQIVTLAHTAYAPVPDTDPVKYIQAKYTAEFLKKLVQANEPVLSNLQVSQEHDLPIPVSKDMSLDRLADLGIRDPEMAWPIFEALWSELVSTTAAQPRPAILFSIEGIAHVSKLSNYIDPSMHYIHAFDLKLVDHFVSHLSGARALPNGGMILAADSASNRPSSLALDLAIRQSESTAESEVQQLPLYDPERPYDVIDPRVLECLRQVPIWRLSGLSKDEARVLLEYYAKSGLLKQTVTESLVSEKWAIAGRGIIGELERENMRRLMDVV